MSSLMEVDASFDVAAATPIRPSAVSQAASKAAMTSLTDSISPIAESLPELGNDSGDPTPNRPSVVGQAASGAPAPLLTDSISPIAETLRELGNNHGDPSLTNTAFIRTNLVSGTSTAFLPDSAVSSHRIYTSSIINSVITEPDSVVSFHRISVTSNVNSVITEPGTIISLPSKLSSIGTHFAEGQHPASNELRPQTSETKRAQMTLNSIIQVSKSFPACSLLSKIIQKVSPLSMDTPAQPSVHIATPNSNSPTSSVSLTSRHSLYSPSTTAVASTSLDELQSSHSSVSRPHGLHSSSPTSNAPDYSRGYSRSGSNSITAAPTSKIINDELQATSSLAAASSSISGTTTSESRKMQRPHLYFQILTMAVISMYHKAFFRTMRG